MPSTQLALLLAIGEGVQTALANQGSDEAMAKSKSIGEALTKVKGGN
jgi:hypothetical protein